MLRPSLLCFILINNLFLPGNCMNMLGPADLRFKSFGGCDPPVEEVFVKITQRKYNRTSNVLDVMVTTPIALSDDLELELKSAVKKEGGYKPGGFYLKDKLCKVLTTMLGDLFNEFLKKTGRDECPLPEGSYEVLGFYLDNDIFQVPQIYGEHKVQTSVFEDEELKACYNIYIDVVPKT